MDKRLQLFYWDGGNFGDDLNIWLWSKLLPHVVDTETPYKRQGMRPLFLGIGTILSDALPKSQSKIIFGSGAGYYEFPTVDSSWKVYCVRGPLTAQKLGLDRKYAITDPAALIRMIELPNVPKEFRYAFMPHHSSIIGTDWRAVCESMGIKYIDPTQDFSKCLNDIRASEIVIAEAMHAAIVADALRMPWVPVNFHGKDINSFKWNDWCQSLGIKYSPHTLGIGENGRLIKRRLPVFVQGAVKNLINYPIACRALRGVIGKAVPMLSSDTVIETATSRLLEQMDILSRDFYDGILTETG